MFFFSGLGWTGSNYRILWLLALNGYTEEVVARRGELGRWGLWGNERHCWARSRHPAPWSLPLTWFLCVSVLLDNRVNEKFWPLSCDYMKKCSMYQVLFWGWWGPASFLTSQEGRGSSESGAGAQDSISSGLKVRILTHLDQSTHSRIWNGVMFVTVLLQD